MLYTDTTFYDADEGLEWGADANAPVADFLVWRDMRVFDGALLSRRRCVDCHVAFSDAWRLSLRDPLVLLVH